MFWMRRAINTLMRNLKLLLVPLVVLLIGCTKTKTEVQEVFRHADNLFGEAFRHEQIYNASPQIKQWSEAVVFIQGPSGPVGTGTIVSESGRILTNEHVVTKYNCPSGEICHGVRMLRAAYPGGPTELMPAVRLIASAGEGIDAAILEFVDQSRKYPFVPLANDKEIFEFRSSSESRELVVLGHPHAGVLKASRARVLAADDKSGAVTLSGVAISGNSGSALIDSSIGKVVGVYHSSEWIKDSVMIESGVTKREGYGTDLLQIRKVFGLQDLATGSSPDNKAAPLSRSRILNEPFYKISSNVGQVPVLIDSLTAVARNDVERAQVSSRIVELVQTSVDSPTVAAGLIRRLMNNILRDEKQKFEHYQPLFEALWKTQQDVNFESGLSTRVWQALAILGGPRSRAMCIKSSSDSRYSRQIRRCLAFDHEEDGTAIIEKFLGVAIQPDFTDFTEEDLLVNLEVVQLVARHVDLTSVQRELLARFTQELVLSSKMAWTIYSGEMLVHLLQTNPDFLRGWRASQIPSASILNTEGPIKHILDSIEATLD